ncbi:MAG: cytochrome c3 family protein [Thermoanaerobaculia bacterium]
MKTLLSCVGLLAALWFALVLGPDRSEASPSLASAQDGRVCLECHDFDEAMASKFPHPPITEGDCIACHNPHVSRIAGLLLERPGVLCASCHPNTTLAAQRTVIHQPFAEGACTQCHQPHGGNIRGMLLDQPNELCATCHSEIESWKAKKVQHTPFAQGRCGNCHEPHSASAESLVKNDGAGLCAACHQASAGLRASHSGYPVETASCATCHDPHASARRGLFRETLHEPFASGDCTSCHQAAASSEPFALVEPLTKLCADCHSDQVEASIAAPYPHISAGGGACVACHNPHAGEGASMLKSSTESVCLSCHDPGGSKSGQPLRFSSHGEGVGCSDCHMAHGGPRPVLLRQDSIELCAECHTHEHSIRHPVGEEAIDVRTGSSMTCLSCHSIHEPGYEMYLHASDERDLCIGCHKEIGGGSS